MLSVYIEGEWKKRQLISQNTHIRIASVLLKINFKIKSKEMEFCTLSYKDIYIYIVKGNFDNDENVCFYRQFSPMTVDFTDSAK